jgi:hypothetical protein
VASEMGQNLPPDHKEAHMPREIDFLTWVQVKLYARIAVGIGLFYILVGLYA